MNIFSINSVFRGLARVLPVKFYKRNMSNLIQGTASDELKRIVWVDLEMTGLDIEKDHILEVACLVTDGKLDIIAEGPNLILHQPVDVLNNMNAWCLDHHGKTGLIQESLKSKLSLPETEKILLDFVEKHVGKGVCPLAGNSVYIDRLFLRKYLPNFNDYLHYRIIDVSTIKELCRRWYPMEFSEQPKKKLVHRAMSDIKESINELKYFRQSIFK
ncbi:probable oligoribonuclease isoform X2 [Chrysoperla carnea]|uniref:probable oligoribonuclease isoform X2 n=1 Tax=Chrysoperla carnea TaxID=189513 RepID=UPI001D091B9D|nr:probable oligoribonuclease isoform X2 [Chrysoperla carnea]